jgi:hypothetical protein
MASVKPKNRTSQKEFASSQALGSAMKQVSKKQKKNEGEQWKMNKTSAAIAVVFIVSLLASSNFAIHPVAGNPTTPNDLIVAGLNWLQTQTSGSPNYYLTYDGLMSVGLTALYVLAYINYYKLPSTSTGTEVIDALDWMVAQQQSSDGSITVGAVSRECNKVYDTSAAILAFVAAAKCGWTPPAGLIDSAVNFLLNAQCVHSTALLPEDTATYSSASPYWGGWGYPRTNWADLSNTQFAVLALAAAQLSGLSTVTAINPGSAVWTNAAIYAIRCQNDATNNPSWYLSTDGGFMYQPAAMGGYYHGSYASMTGAGIWVLDLCDAEGIPSVVMPDPPHPTVTLTQAAGLGVSWLDANVHNNNWAGNYPIGNEFFFYFAMSVSKAYVFSQKSRDTWWFFPPNQMFDKLNSLFSGTPSVSGYWPSVWGEEPDDLSTVEAILALELCLPPLGVNLDTVLYSNANLYITDPDGRHIGWDPVTHAIVNQIPGATYTGPSTEPQEITIPDPLPGVYNITLVGTASGPYNITVFGNSTTGKYFSQTFNGTASPGKSTLYSAVVTSMIGPFTTIVTPGQLPTPPPPLTCRADLNMDGVVDVDDVTMVAGAFGSYPGHPKWNSAYDMNEDNIIDVYDVSYVCHYFGWHSP